MGGSSEGTNSRFYVERSEGAISRSKRVNTKLKEYTQHGVKKFDVILMI